MELPDTPPVDGADHYAALFRQNIVRGVQATLRQMPQGDALLSADEKAQALHALDFGLELADAWPHVRDLMLHIASKMEQAGHRGIWLGYLERGVKQADKVEDRAALAKLLLQLGYLNQLKSNYDAAYVHYRSSAEIFLATDDIGNYVRALNQQAFVAWLQRRPAEAQALTNVVLELMAPNDPKCATSYSVRGWLALDKSDWYTAEANFTLALELWEKEGDKRQIARRLRDLCNSLYPQKRFAEAIEQNKRALALFRQIDDRYEWAVTQMNLGAVYLEMKKPSEALPLFEELEKPFVDLQDILHLAMLYHNWGIAHRDVGGFTSAEEKLSEAINRYQSLHRTDLQVNALDDLGVAYALSGQPIQAIATFEQAMVYLTTIESAPGYQRLADTVHAHLEEAISSSTKGEGDAPA